MIPTIIYLLLRRYRRSNPQKASAILAIIRKTGLFLLLLLVLFGIGYSALSQQTTLEYSIKRKGRVIGTMTYSRQVSGTTTLIKVETNIKARMIFLVTANALEEAIYENGIMTYSFLYRKMNGSEKLNMKTWLTGETYVVSKGRHAEKQKHVPIRYNMICLYMQEPFSPIQVYSDNFQRFLSIQKLGNQHYKIAFPDGNYNIYYYEKGICSKVEVHHSLYSSTIELK